MTSSSVRLLTISSAWSVEVVLGAEHGAYRNDGGPAQVLFRTLLA